MNKILPKLLPLLLALGLGATPATASAAPTAPQGVGKLLRAAGAAVRTERAVAHVAAGQRAPATKKSDGSDVVSYILGGLALLFLARVVLVKTGLVED